MFEAGRPGRRSGLPVVFAVLIGLTIAGCSSGPSNLPTESATRASPTGSPSPLPTVEGSPIPQADASLGSIAAIGLVQPVRLAIPELSIDMTVEPEGVDAKGAMDLPADAATAGWYRFGPGLRDAAGATVIAAHIDSWHDGIGPFSKLKGVSMGSVITVGGSDGSSVAYTVSDVREVGKIDAPMAEVFDRAGSPRLTLVTCGGAFNSTTGHYLDNIIVTAVPAPAGATANG